MTHRKTTEASRDDWQTPPHISRPLIERFKFTGDCAASAVNTVAPQWIDEERDSLLSSWSSLGDRVFCNPPYSKVGFFIKRAQKEAKANRRLVACLVPATPGNLWFHNWAISHAREIWFYRGRISFLSPVDGEPMPANPVGSVLVVFNGTQAFSGPRIGSLCAKSGLPVHDADQWYWRRASKAN